MLRWISYKVEQEGSELKGALESQKESRLPGAALQGGWREEAPTGAEVVSGISLQAYAPLPAGSNRH